MFSTVAELGVPIVMMHMRGTPQTMTQQEFTTYPTGDCIQEIASGDSCLIDWDCDSDRLSGSSSLPISSHSTAHESKHKNVFRAEPAAFSGGHFYAALDADRGSRNRVCKRYAIQP